MSHWMCPIIRSRCGLAGLLIGLAGCGEPLVDGHYHGEPLLTLHGSVYIEPGTDQFWPEDPLRIALFWAHGDDVGPSPEYEQAVVATTSFPAQYTLNLYQPPPEEVLFDAPWSGTARTAIATPLLYLDENFNERWDRHQEPIIGGSYEVVAVFATEDADEDESYVELESGYQRMFSNVNYCGVFEPDAIEVFPAESYPVDLWVGPFWDYLDDWDCDGEFEEWDGICPMEEMELLNFCENHEEFIYEEFFDLCLPFCEDY